MKINDAYPSAYLKAADLNGKAVRVVIESVSVERVGDDKKPVLHFLGKEKTLVLNKTNSNRIVEAVGSDETDEWEGWSITLYPCKVDYAGKRVDAIRVDDRPGATRKPQRSVVRPPQQPAQMENELPDDDYQPEAPELTEDDIPF